jgi:hypothetical protein
MGLGVVNGLGPDVDGIYACSLTCSSGSFTVSTVTGLGGLRGGTSLYEAEVGLRLGIPVEGPFKFGGGGALDGGGGTACRTGT